MRFNLRSDTALKFACNESKHNLMANAKAMPEWNDPTQRRELMEKYKLKEENMALRRNLQFIVDAMNDYTCRGANGNNLRAPSSMEELAADCKQRSCQRSQEPQIPSIDNANPKVLEQELKLKDSEIDKLKADRTQLQNLNDRLITEFQDCTDKMTANGSNGQNKKIKEMEAEIALLKEQMKNKDAQLVDLSEQFQAMESEMDEMYKIINTLRRDGKRNCQNRRFSEADKEELRAFPRQISRQISRLTSEDEVDSRARQKIGRLAQENEEIKKKLRRISRSSSNRTESVQGYHEKKVRLVSVSENSLEIPRVRPQDDVSVNGKSLTNHSHKGYQEKKVRSVSVSENSVKNHQNEQIARLIKENEEIKRKMQQMDRSNHETENVGIYGKKDRVSYDVEDVRRRVDLLNDDKQSVKVFPQQSVRYSDAAMEVKRTHSQSQRGSDIIEETKEYRGQIQHHD